jgi:predicted site-specific integrase-resolvase
MKIKEVKHILGVTNRTVNNYINQGLIRFTKINKNHYDYNDDDVLSLINKKNPNRNVVTYARVSLPKQKNDLITQNERLYNYAISNGYVLSKQYQDIKSGMNFNDRKEFNQLLNQVIDNKIETIIIENKDRLCRFGFDLFENFCKQFNCKIIVTTEVENISYEQELTQDLISIIHHFSMKSYSNRRKLNKIKQELLKETELSDAND